MVPNGLGNGSEEGAEFGWRDQNPNLWIRISTEFFYSHRVMVMLYILEEKTLQSIRKHINHGLLGI